MSTQTRRGLTLIGILVALGCIVVLMSIYMSSVSKSVTGGKGTSSATSAWGMIDKIQLLQIGNALKIDSQMNGQYLTPSKLSRSGDIRDNTSANFWSAMLLQRLVTPEALVSKTDPSWVEKATPNYRARFWDP
ncbi:MAG: hypothetical protein HOC27_02495, partial [Phycisphaerae bacterium]|nr:hypothetical protein [Phycisphaerae bacterium]